MQETKETQVQSLGPEVLLEEGMATHFNILAWKILWTESMGWQSQTWLSMSAHHQKGRNKMVSVCRWHDLIYINPRDTTKGKKLLNKFSAIAGYKINTQKSVTCPYINSKLPEKELKKQSFAQCHQNNKIPRNKFNQGGKRSVHWKLPDTDKRNWRNHRWMENILCSWPGIIYIA